MQRWHLTAGLAGAAALAALVVPSLHGGGTPVGGLIQDGQPPAPLQPPEPQGFDGALVLSADIDQGALLQGSGQDRYLVVDVRAPDMPGDLRRPVNVAVVMDTSGSMAGRGKIDNARMAAAELIGQLGPQDTFSLVTFSDRARVVVPSSSVTDPVGLRRLVSGIRPAGGTYLSAGLEQGLAQLASPDMEGVRRVILLSDGMANIGVTDRATLARTAGSLVEQGITVSALGLGLDYDEDLLTAMSDAGGGAYHFVDRPGQLASLFGQELQQMSRLAGREVAVDVHLPPGVHLSEVYGYSASTSTDGYRVFLGDVHGGEARKIVARVHVDDASVGTLKVADVDLAYLDADSGKHSLEKVAVAAQVTRDTALARASLNKGVGSAAIRAKVGTILENSARDFADGDVAGNQRQLEDAKAELRAASATYGAPELEADASDIEEQRMAFESAAAAPASEPALYQVKKAKEDARGYAR